MVGRCCSAGKSAAREIKFDRVLPREQTLGVGAGQMARVDSSLIALEGGRTQLDLHGSVVASERSFLLQMDSLRPRMRAQPRRSSPAVRSATRESSRPPMRGNDDGVHWHPTLPPLTG